MFTITIVFRDFSHAFEMTKFAMMSSRQSVATRDLIQMHRITSPLYINKKNASCSITDILADNE